MYLISSLYPTALLTQICRTLFISTILLFALSTAHIGLSLRQLLEAFTDPAVALVPHGADIYFVTQSNPLALAQYVVYSTNVSYMLIKPCSAC